MAQKFIHKVSPDLTDDASYKSFSAIESHALTQGSTIRFYPGNYEMGSFTLDGVNVEGVGDRSAVLLCNANLTVANSVSIKNVTFSGNSGVVASTGASLFITNASNASAVARFSDVSFINGDFGVDSQGQLALHFARIDAATVDRFLRSNSTMSANISYSVLNNSANAYFTAANSAQKAVQVRSSFGGGSNGAGTTKVVSANVA